MKTLVNAFLCTTLIVFAVGCGKDGGGGGGSSKSKSSNNYNIGNNYQNADAISAKAYENLISWYKSTSENSAAVGYLRELRITQTMQNPNDSQVCKNKEIFGFIDFQYCKQTQQYSPVAPTATTVNVVTGINKSKHKKLEAVFNSGLTLIQAKEEASPVLKKGKLYTLQFRNSNNQIVYYKIDT
jgi:hypothetical protein